MKKRFIVSIIIILAVGTFVAMEILKIDPNTQSSKHSPVAEKTDAIPRGSHGGWLFSKDNLQVEVKIFESGVPPQFRVYTSNAKGDKIPFDEVQLTIRLNRLDRIDEIHFNPAGDYLLGDMTVEEPHSFDMEIQALWKDQKYEWNFSQIEARVELSETALKNANIVTKKVGSARLKNILKLSGEIGLNEEKVVHVVPRLTGIVKQVFKDLGDHVAPGEILAIIESRELANTKIAYLSAAKRTSLVKADMEREILLYKNTTRMLELLQKEISKEEIDRELKELPVGKSRELLIPAHSKLSLAKSVYLREKKLFEKGISSQSEYLQAEENYKSREATYFAIREKIAYDGQWAVHQKTRAYEMENLKLQTTSQKLFALGLTNEEVDKLSQKEEPILTQYELKSPLGGTVIQKHLSTGEAVKNDDGVFLLADLSELWANIAIPAKDIKYVKLGQSVTVRDENLGTKAVGKLTYLASIIDEKNRTITGRVVIQNPKSKWRPGTFVTLELLLDKRKVPVAVPTKAIQTIRDWSVVFVNYGDFFEARPLELGESDGTWTEVLKGLTAGEQYVTENSFVVKAEIEKSSAVHSH